MLVSRRIPIRQHFIQKQDSKKSFEEGQNARKTIFEKTKEDEKSQRPVGISGGDALPDLE